MYNAELSEKSLVVANDLMRAVTEMMSSITEKKTIFSTQIRREMANAFFVAHSGIIEPMKNTEDFLVSAADGYGIPVRKYTPLNLQSDSVVLFAHGGGWIQGNLDTHDYLCRKMASTLGIVVVAADYRLAPEFIFPIPLEDLLDVYKWCGETFCGKNIILAGDSAGGNLCAALCLKLAERKISPQPFAQVLFYPVLSNDFESKSFKAYENIVMSKNAITFALACYVGKACTD
jgi:acetyl esterase/lipase